MSATVNSACVAAKLATNDTWRCYIAPDLLPFIQTPMFVSNSLSDAWQAGAIMGLGCAPSKPGGCSAAALAYVADFRTQMLAALAPVTRAGSPHGGFLQGCFVHVVEDVGSWATVKVPSGAGQTQAQTFAAFLGTGPGARLAVDTFPPWSNPTC